MDGGETLGLSSRLAQPVDRRAAAAQLAHHLGAQALMVFLREPELQAFLPAPGFPQTVPGGPTWVELLHRCETAGEHRGTVAFPDRESRTGVLAISTVDGLIFALLGGEPRVERVDLLCLPFLAATFRAELAAQAARGKEAAAREEARHSAALTSVLDATRADLERALGEARRLNAALKSADQRKDEFLAMLGHELRNPLSPMVSAFEILRRQGQRGPSLEKLLQVMERQTRHLMRLVDDLLDVSRISQGRIDLRRETLTIGSTLRQAVDSVRPLIGKDRHALSLSIPESPIYVLGDPVRLTQVFTNLLANASKYTDPGGRIDVSVAREGESVVVRVRDTGVGIDKEILPVVFELFTQAPRSLDRAKGGLGIGLTLVKRLVALHGGSVEARSEGAGRGSEFTVRLPVVASPAHESQTTRSAPPAVEPQHVLIVEDNADAAELLAESLRTRGFTVRIASEGEEGVSLALEVSPTLVLLDIGLPKMDGYDVARRLRKELPAARLVALSGYGGAEYRARAQEAGFDGYLVKPVELDELRALLDSLGSKHLRSS